MRLRHYVPGPVKKQLRPVMQFFQDQGLRGQHVLKFIQGRELWVRPQVSCAKRRLGRGDGEWCICPDSIKPDSVVYSFGVGWDISFDEALIKLYGVEVHAFDPTPIAREWLEKREKPAGFHFHPYGLANYDGVAEFALPVSHGVSFTLLTDVASRLSAKGDVCRLGTIMSRLGHDRVHLLKLDIEGAEYDVIPDLVALAPRVDQLLVEFHHRLLNGESGLDRTRQALKALDEAGFRLFAVSPRGYEYSFIRDDH
jgi:FkbM family methyltransferase